jgi:hypothetical protein
MEPLKAELMGIPRSKNEVSKLIGQLISEKFRADVIQVDAREVDVGDINFSATYDSDLDSMNKPCIEVFIVYCNLDDVVIFDEELFDTVTKRLCDSISHEQIHQRQSRSRYWEDPFDVDTDDTEAYLSNKDEIDAYSYNIANELLDYADRQKVLTLLQQPSTISIEHSVNLWTYLVTFDYDYSHPVIKRLIQKVVKILPQVEQER